MKRYRQHIKEMRNLEKRLTTRSKKKIKKVFLDFADKILKDNGQKYADEEAKVIIAINYEYLAREIKDALEIIFLYNLDETIGCFKTIYNKKLSSKVIKGIRDYVLENYNKKHAAEKVSRITETTRKRLNKLIEEGQAAGWSRKTMVEEIQKSVVGMSEYRADTMARTETTSSSNTTTYNTAKAAKMKEKGWVHLGGKKTYRENHKALNGRWIKIDELWNLGKGITTQAPHGAELPASEVVRCNCLQIYR